MPELIHSAPRLNLAWRIRTTFVGSLGPRLYLTPDIRHEDPGWGSEIFGHPIERLEMFLPTGHKVLLAGMEKYNFVVEAVQCLSGSHPALINAFWLFGKSPLSPDVWTWRVGNGRVVHSKKRWGKEWAGGPTRGWKKGVVGASPVSELVRS